MGSAEFDFPCQVTVCAGSRRLFPQICKKYGTRVFLVSGTRSMREAGVLQELSDIAKENGLRIFAREGVPSNPMASDADRIAAAARSYGPDVIIGLGGGSAIDCAKAAALLVTHGGKARDYLNLPGQKAKAIPSPVCPVIAIPTTSGSGSEATPFAVLTDDDTALKKGIGSRYLYPVAALLDPELTALMPRQLTAYSGFDAFAQALEGFTSGNATIISDSCARESILQIIKNLEKSVKGPKDLVVRQNMSWGSALSGLSIGLVDVNLAHAMSHPLSSLCGLHHGLAVALCTVPAMRFNERYAGDRYRYIASVFRRVYGRGLRVRENDPVAMVGRWLGRIDRDIPRGLVHYIAKAPDYERLAADALEIGAIRTNVRDVGRDDLVELYKMAWNGRGA